MRTDRIARLEALTQEAARRLAKLSDENDKLRRAAERLQEENGRLAGELKRLKNANYDRLRARLERLAQKLDKASELAGQP